MKKDYYFPHEIRTRNDEAVMELIECEGASGYGIYWALIEYLRTQEGYVGKMIAVKTIARQMRTKAHKVDSVLRNYELFVIEGNTFRSVRLEKVMRPLDEKRTAMEARNERNAKAKQEQCVNSAGATSEQKSDNSLKTNDDVSLSKVKESKEENTPLAMRTGLKKRFYTFYPRIVKSFKQHVRLLGNVGFVLPYGKS